MKKLVIFDLDGTLTNTLKSIQKSANMALEAYGFAPYEVDRYRYFVGNGSAELIRQCLIHDGDPELSHFDEVMGKYEEVFEQYCMYEVKPYDGIWDLIAMLKKKGFLLAVNSNKPQAQTEDVISSVFGDDIFDMVVGQVEVRPRKPAPDGVQFILSKLGVTSEETVYLGDTSIDMQTGKSAGVFTVGALWGFRDREELEDNHADAIIASPMELLSHVDSANALGCTDDAGGGKIRLIATDVDGTLVKDSSREVGDEVIEAIQKLTDQGIYFTIASGRQYGSIRRMFERAQRNLLFIAENGAHIVKDGQTYGLTKMERAHVEEIMADLRSLYSQDCHVVASTSKGCFLESKDEDFIHLIRENYRNDVTLTEDILAEDAEFVKLAVYQKGSIREIGESFLIPKWKEKVKTCMAGEEWVDFMDFSVDKGNALKILQEGLGIAPEETMVFGDNENDIGLLRAAGESYAVENALPVVKEAAKYVCPPYWEHGVCQVLRTLYEK